MRSHWMSGVQYRSWLRAYQSENVVDYSRYVYLPLFSHLGYRQDISTEITLLKRQSDDIGLDTSGRTKSVQMTTKR